MSRSTFFSMVTLAGILLSICPPSWGYSAQQLKVTNSAASHLLTQSTIVSLFVDQTGFLWIASQDGLKKYDGSKASSIYGSSADLTRKSSYDVRQVTQAVDGVIWFATYGSGLLKFDPSTNSLSNIQSSDRIQAQYSNTILADKQGRIWLGHTEGIAIYNPDKAQFAYSISDRSDPHHLGNVAALAEDENGVVWIASDQGLFSSSDGLSALQRISISSVHSLDNSEFKITALETLDREQRILGFSTGELILLADEKDSNDSYFALKASVDARVTSIQFHIGLIWVGTDKGLYILSRELETLRFLSKRNSGLSNDHVTYLQSHEGTLWVGTYQGLDIITLSSFASYTAMNSSVSNEVMSFGETTAGQTIIGTYSGLYLLDEASQSHSRIEVTFPFIELVDNRIMSIAVKGDEAWLGYREGGVEILNLSSGTTRRLRLPNSSALEVTRILHTSRGETWIGTYNSGLFLIDQDNSISSVALPQPGSSSSISKVTLIEELEDGSVLIGAEKTIYYYDVVTREISHLPLPIEVLDAAATILSIAQYKHDILLVGTKELGLLCLDFSKSYLIIACSNVYPDLRSANSGSIYAIEIDKNDGIWASTSKGLIHLPSLGEAMQEFSVSAGLQGRDFNFGSSFIDSKGRLYFGGSNGYNRFDPSEVTIDATPPDVVLTDLNIAGERPPLPVPLHELEGIVLDYTDYFIRLTFSALDFLDPNNNQYRYMLEGFDRDWIENGNRNTATYTNLPPGTYTFRVQGTGSNGIWNRDGIALSLKVNPPPWRSAWAYLSYLLGLLLLVWLARKYYDTYRLKERATEMAEEMHEAADRAMDDLQEQLEYKDELLRSANDHQKHTLRLIADSISVQSRYLVDDAAIEACESSTTRIIVLRELEKCVFYQNDDLLVDMKKYINLIIPLILARSAIATETITTINNATHQLFASRLATPLAIVIYELLDNAAQHAFELGCPANYIQIDLARERDTETGLYTINLKVQDSGVGLPDNIRISDLRSSGLEIVSDMVKELSGEMKISSETGTQIAIQLPEPPLGTE